MLGAPPRVGKGTNARTPGNSMYTSNISDAKKAMLWIRDVFILIRIRGSTPLVYGSVDPYHWFTDPDPALFSSGFQVSRCKQYSVPRLP